MAFGLGFVPVAQSASPLGSAPGPVAMLGGSDELHLLIVGVFAVIALVVFGAMIHALVKFETPGGAESGEFLPSKKAEVAWTILAAAILLGTAFPATQTLVAISDERAPELAGDVTGFQGLWRDDHDRDFP